MSNCIYVLPQQQPILIKKVLNNLFQTSFGIDHSQIHMHRNESLVSTEQDIGENSAFIILVEWKMLFIAFSKKGS